MLRQQKIMYWTATTLISVIMLFSAYVYLVETTLETAFTHLGFPAYFRVELAIAKIIGTFLLLVPIRGSFKEWVYAGFTFTFISASLAHLNAGDAVATWISPLLFLGVLLISYIL